MDTLIGVVLGGAFLTFLQFLIQRHDKKHDRFKTIEDKIEAVGKRVDEIAAAGDRREAVSARVRILRFGDEMLEGRKHSKDSYDQVLTDVTSYTSYVARHPDFYNDITTATVEHIKRSYADRLERRDFLKWQ